MRHGKKVNHLGRTSSHRNAMLSNMASSLIMHKRISTTVAKAKALRKYIEPLITRSKDDSTHSRRMVFSYLQDKVAVTELFRDISQKIGDRPGGYTRILRTGFRVGDAAEMCLIELVDYNDNYTQNKGGKRAKAKSTRRGGGRTRKKEETPDAINVETTVKEEVPVIEEASATVEAEIVEETPAVEEVVEETPIAEEVPVVEETAEPEIVAETPIAEEEK
jgi:large subunit ribosomal protein L17